LTERTHFYGAVPPDTITLYQRPIELTAGSRERIPEVVNHTVLHEVAHHFGISDDRLRELGAY
jgi:predicted Zn-dependent protease with MMP-like domain